MRTRTIILAALTPILIAAQATPAAWAEAPLETTTVVLSQAAAASEIASGPRPDEASAFLSTYADATDAEVAELTASLPGTPTVRTVLPTTAWLYVADLTETATGATERAYIIARDGSLAPQLVAAADSVIGGAQITGTASSPLTSSTTANRMALADPLCTGCVAAGGAAGIAVGVACLIGPLTLFGGFVCVGLGAVLSAGVGVACSANQCPSSLPPGLNGMGASCDFSSCAMKAEVYNGTNRQLISLGSSAIWSYPGTAYAQYDSGGNGSVKVDESSAGLYPTLSTSTGQTYQWTHYASEPRWTACATTVRLSISAQWSDYSYGSTGYMAPQPKMAIAGTCTNYHP